MGYLRNDQMPFATHPESMSQRYTTKPQNEDFISHIPVFKFRQNSSPCYTTHVCQPILNQHPKDTPQNLRSQDFHLTHPIPVLNFAGTALHVSPRICANPSWTNVPQIHHKRLMTQFCKPILIQLPKIHLSKFQYSPCRRQKRLIFLSDLGSLQEDIVQ